MSYETVREEVFALGADLEHRFKRGDPLTLTAHDIKPEFLVHSFKPLAYESFGAFRNRAPRLTGTLALRSLLVAPSYSGAFVFLGVQTERAGYGIRANDPEQVNDIAEQLGYPRTFFAV